MLGQEPAKSTYGCCCRLRIEQLKSSEHIHHASLQITVNYSSIGNAMVRVRPMFEGCMTNVRSAAQHVLDVSGVRDERPGHRKLSC